MEPTANSYPTLILVILHAFFHIFDWKSCRAVAMKQQNCEERFLKWDRVRHVERWEMAEGNGG